MVSHQRLWQIANPDKFRAQRATSKAIRTGRLQRGPCTDCGATDAQAHHEDYTKPLDVTWLCKQCHIRRHVALRIGKRKKDRGRGPVEPALTILREQGRSIAWLARAIGCDRSYLSQMLHGHLASTRPIRLKCARVLNLPEAILFHSDSSSDSGSAA